jgi:MarR family transcriptional regulator, transcriptional regulator for hemolysin
MQPEATSEVVTVTRSLHITDMSKSARAPAETGASESLMSLVMDVADELGRRTDAALAKEGLSWAKAAALECLAAAQDPLTLGELAQENECVRSNITQMVDRLETDGLVRRVNDPDDRRVRRAALTSNGRKACKEASRVLAAQEQALARALTPDEADTLARLLRKLLAKS